MAMQIMPGRGLSALGQYFRNRQGRSTGTQVPPHMQSVDPFLGGRSTGSPTPMTYDYTDAVPQVGAGGYEMASGMNAQAGIGLEGALARMQPGQAAAAGTQPGAMSMMQLPMQEPMQPNTTSPAYVSDMMMPSQAGAGQGGFALGNFGAAAAYPGLSAGGRY